MNIGQIKVTGVAMLEKDGKRSWVLHGITPFEDWEHGEGLKTTSEWTNKVDLSNLKQGMVVEPVYSKGFQGKAVLSNIRVIDASAGDKAK